MTREWIGNLTYEQAEWHYHAGLIGERDWRAYVLAWTWCGVRWGGTAGLRQERFHGRLGYDALERRRARARKLANAYFGA